MLLWLNIAQLILYIGLLALAGQGALYVLAGAGRQRNLFYQLFQMVNRPWIALGRWLAPRALAPRTHPLVAFCVMAALYLAVTLAKIEHCLAIGVEACR